ncbi:MAG: ADP-ribosylglycohydrolase family protein [Halioglobus sp.]
MDELSSFRACLLGGAVGDALGGAVEFMSLDAIQKRFGPGGIRDYATAYGREGAITDDTQMTLFTAEGLIRGLVRERHKGISSFSSVTAAAYQRWLLTQGNSNHADLDCISPETGWLFTVRELHSQRAPGLTCLSALRDARELGMPAANDSKGCGGVMRVAPVGLFAETVQDSFKLGCELAALTHGHPTGWLAGGALAAMITAIRQGASLLEAINVALECLAQQSSHEETTAAVTLAVELSADGGDPHAAISQLGEGWIAEEALAIAVYCALVAPNFEEGVVMAVNHGGDSDSTGAIAGNLLGLLGGEQCLPQRWLDGLELREVIIELADDLFDCRQWSIGPYAANTEFDQRAWEKYPGY